MRHKIKIGPNTAVAVAVGALALVLWGCGEESGSGRAGRTVDELKTVSCLPENNSNVGDVTYSAERIEDGVAFGWLCMGDPNAPVTMVEFASLTCHFCANFHKDTFPEIKRQYIDTGQVRLVFANFVRDQYDLAASKIMRCGGPIRAFALADLFFRSQEDWTGQDALDQLAALARRAGMNRVKFDACLANRELQKHLDSRTEVASSKYAVSSTPTFFINGEEVLGAQPFEVFEEVIERKF